MDPVSSQIGYPPGAVNPKDAVTGPAIFLLVVGVVGVLLALGSLASSFTPMEIPPEAMEQLPDELRPFFEQLTSSSTNMAMGFLSSLVPLLASAFVIFGAIRMKDLRGHTLAVVASILAMIPCLGPCCCLGLPAGIWSLVVLFKPEVRAAFRD